MITDTRELIIELNMLKAEIDRLNATIKRQKEALDRWAEHDPRSLLIRAADALDYQLRFITQHCCDGYPNCKELADELRKAAE